MAQKMYGTPRKRFSTIFVTSRQLKSCFRTFKQIRFNAFWILFAASEPKTVAFTSSAMKKKFHPAAWILRSRAKPSIALTTLQFPE